MRCECDTGYTGQVCEIAIVSCGDHGSNFNATVCNCTDGYTGELCQLEPRPSSSWTTLELTIFILAVITLVASAGTGLYWVYGVYQEQRRSRPDQYRPLK